MTLDITIVAVDTFAHELVKLSIDRTLACLEPKKILTFSDRPIHNSATWIPIRPISRAEYNVFVTKTLWPFITTDHVLIVQYDGMAVNNAKWTDDYLNYDYIGAKWVDNVVGNGGFSLRSRRLYSQLQSTVIHVDTDIEAEDVLICRKYYNYLVDKGIKFAPYELADQFSHENWPGFSDTFGFHGSFNVPYYLDDRETAEFIDLLPDYNSRTNLAMLDSLQKLGKNDLIERYLRLQSTANK